MAPTVAPKGREGGQGLQNSRHGENIQLIGEGYGDGHSGRSALHRCRSTTCRVSSRGLEASRGHRFRRLSSRRCSHVPAHFQHSRCAKTVAKQQTWLAGSPPMSGVLDSSPGSVIGGLLGVGNLPYIKEEIMKVNERDEETATVGDSVAAVLESSGASAGHRPTARPRVIGIHRRRCSERSAHPRW